MAVDLMILPLSRYIAGDYVTPMMQACWAQGLTYELIGPEGARKLPPNVPMGGEGAAEQRERIQDLLHEDLLKWPSAIAGALWDEHSQAEPRFHRLPHAAYGQLLDLAAGKKGFLGFGGFPKLPELGATLFVPQRFDGTFEVEEPLRAVVASAPRLLAALKNVNIPGDAKEAGVVLLAGLSDVVELRLPLVVDG